MPRKGRVLAAYLPAYSYIESLRKLINFITKQCNFYIYTFNRYLGILRIHFHYLFYPFIFSSPFQCSYFQIYFTLTILSELK